MKGDGKGVERGMIIIVAPRFGRKELDGAIEHRSRSHKKAEQRRIERCDVVEMNHASPQSHQAAHEEGSDDEHKDGQEDEHVGVGEEVDELRYGGVGRDLSQQFALMNPSQRMLVASDFYPHRIDAVGRHCSDIGYDKASAMRNREGVDRQSIYHLSRMLNDEQ